LEAATLEQIVVFLRHILEGKIDFPPTDYSQIIYKNNLKNNLEAFWKSSNEMYI
jgi:hypothetical protein